MSRPANRARLGARDVLLSLALLALAPLLVLGSAFADGVSPFGGSDAGEAAASPLPLERLPDLDQETPSDVTVAVAGSRQSPTYVLGFRSAVRNIGSGPFVIQGRRVFPAGDLLMQADQIIRVDAGKPGVVSNVGELHYVRSPDHQHWHLLGFDHYELRRAGEGGALVQDRKSGFCLGDRYQAVPRLLSASPRQKVYRSRCGLGQTGLLSIREGISVGYGDDYKAYLEYQDLPLTGLPDGRYVLVHRVNADRRLREITYDNDAASVLLELRWRSGKPSIQVLVRCPDTDQCDVPPSRPVARVDSYATGLEIPWDIAFLPDGRALVTERPGRIRLLESDGALQPEPVALVPVSARGEGGLLGIALDPDFSSNSFVYLYFTTAQGMKLERWRWTGSGLTPEATLLSSIAAGTVHDSGRIGFGPDGRLYVATGDAGNPALAQDPASLNGKMLALDPDQYRGAGPVAPTVLASGLRNPQGFDWQPGTGALIANDHGPSGFDGPEGYDEVNLITRGANYGWPKVIGTATGNGRFVAPIRVYRQAIAPSGGAFVSRAGSRWTGDYILAALRGEQLRRLVVRGGRVVAEQTLLEGRFGRLRTVREGPDGALYVLTSNRDGRGTSRAGDDRVLRISLP
jgi:glucose/arabinose dehydrogenase